MKTSLLPWVLSAGVVAGIAYVGKNAAAAPAPAPTPPAPGPQPPPPMGAGPLPTGGANPNQPGNLPGATGLTPVQVGVVSTLLDTRILAPSALLEQWAKVAAGPDGKQNDLLVGRLKGKAFTMREEERKGHLV